MYEVKKYDCKFCSLFDYNSYIFYYNMLLASPPLPLLPFASSFTESHRIFIYYNDIERIDGIRCSFPNN